MMSVDDISLIYEHHLAQASCIYRDADSHENTQRYLERNPSHSLVAAVDSKLVGCIMSGHDGRRGYLQHLLVLPEFRHKGIASALVTHCLDALEAVGIRKSYIDVLKTNESGALYWEHMGWQLRTDILRYSLASSGGSNV